MAYRSGDRIRKLDYAGLLTEARSYMTLRQRDAVGMVSFDQKMRRYIPPRSKSGHLLVLLTEVAAQTPSDTTDIAGTLHEMAERIKRRGLVIIISDLLDDADKIILGLRHFRYNRHEVIVFSHP